MEWLTADLVVWWLILGSLGIIWQEICIWQIKEKDSVTYSECPIMFKLTFLLYLCQREKGDCEVGKFYPFSGRTGWRRVIGWFLTIILGPWILVKCLGTVVFGFFVWLFICVISDTWNKIFSLKGGK